MTDIELHPGDTLIAEYEALQNKIRAAAFPALVEEEVTDDGETWQALRCPRCGYIVSNAGDLIAVSPAEHWADSEDIGDHEVDHGIVTFDSSGDRELEPTLYYKHNEHAVSLPDGWTENWT